MPNKYDRVTALANAIIAAAVEDYAKAEWVCRNVCRDRLEYIPQGCKKCRHRIPYCATTIPNVKKEIRYFAKNDGKLLTDINIALILDTIEQRGIYPDSINDFIRAQERERKKKS